MQQLLTSRRDNFVHPGHEVAITNDRQLQPKNACLEGLLFLIDIHIVIVIPLHVVTPVSFGCSSYLLPVFHGLRPADSKGTGKSLNSNVGDVYICHVSLAWQSMNLA